MLKLFKQRSQRGLSAKFYPVKGPIAKISCFAKLRNRWGGDWYFAVEWWYYGEKAGWANETSLAHQILGMPEGCVWWAFGGFRLFEKSNLMLVFLRKKSIFAIVIAKTVRAPKTFLDGYPEATFKAISPDNYLEFLLPG